MSLLSELKERQANLLKMIVEDGEQRYDADFGLCEEQTYSSNQKYGEKYMGHFVCWISPAYAEALLATDHDIRLAAAIIERICDFQELDPGLPMYGNFHGVAEWKAVFDQNAISFLAVSLGVIWTKYGDKLPKRTRDRLYKSLDIGSSALIRRRADVFYTNIYLLTLAGKLLLGKILNRPDLLRLAETEWECYLDRVSRENISECNSPSYTPIHVECLLLIHEHATTAKMRKQAEAALDFTLGLFCLHYHLPSRALSGTMSRAYREGLVDMKDGASIMAHALFGIPLLPMQAEKPSRSKLIWSVIWTRSDYVPPKHLRELFFNKQYPLSITEQNVSYWGRDNTPKIVERYSRQTPLYSLATQYGVWFSYGHFLGFHLTHAGTGNRRAFFIQNEPDYPLLDVWFKQNEDTALGAFFWGLHGYRELRAWWHSAPFDAKHVCHMGARDEIVSFLLDGREWDGRRQPKPGSTIVIVKPEIEMRLRFLDLPKGVRAPKIQLTELHGDTVMYFTYAESESADEFLNLPPAVLPLVFEVRPGGSGKPWREKAIKSKVRNGRWTISAGALSAAVPLTLEARDALAEETNPPLQGNVVTCPGFTWDTKSLRKKFLI